MHRIRTFAKKCLWRSGGYAVIAHARSWRGVAVLAYHGVRDAAGTAAGTSEELHVRREVLNQQLQVIRRLGTPISLDEWREARRAGRRPPDRAVLVTFDDGYRSVMTEAVPLLERYEIPAVVFVSTGPSQRRRLFWFDALERRGRAREIEPAKRLSYEAWRRLAAECETPCREDDERAAMSPEEIARLARHPLIEVGAHTVDHPVLARADVPTQRQQIGDSIRMLEDWTGKPVRAFAYPNGRPGDDFTAETIAVVRDCGIDAAFTTEPRVASGDEPLESCPRFTMLDAISAAQLGQYLSLTWPRAIA
jgi:peptidoglycan/xylan/chitin deacetylase (PgdA/CDA1 family)